MSRNRIDRWTNRKPTTVTNQDHHITPESRGGLIGKNLKVVPSDFHCAYHKLFENMTPSEIQRYLSEIWFTYKVFIKPQDWLINERRIS